MPPLRSLDSSLARILKRGVAAVLLLAGLGHSTAFLAAAECHCGRCPAPRWHVVETANLRLLSFGSHAVDHETAEECEALRETLAKKWLGADVASCWNPKCDIVLHPSDNAYLREVGSGGRDTVASSLVDRKLGRVAVRRIDVRSTQTDWQATALAHELTHLVLADRFTGPLPRWADEGAAILADPREKRSRHLQDFTNAVSGRSDFRVLELMMLADYPPAQRWGAFYGQSASLVEYLVSVGGEEQFVEFLEATFEQGHERALRRVYHMGIVELERRWRERFRMPVDSLASDRKGTTPASSAGASSTSLPAETVSLRKRR